jgi:nitrogenase molybdenum-iron cofactor biosynthesis protein NifN
MARHQSTTGMAEAEYCKGWNMNEICFTAKPLTVNPLKASQPIGASLAILGLAKAMPLEHGARGCTSFDKLFFMRHFREPIALQTTAMDHFTAILGADDNIIDAIATICRKNKADVIGLITTGLSEMQGADIPRTIAAFRNEYPQYAGTAIVPISASDTLGCVETGFSAALKAIIDTLVPTVDERAVRTNKQINILASAMLTPGDLDTIKRWVKAFGLNPIILPDIGDSLDGHMIDEGFSTLSYGGTTRADIERMSSSMATIVIGSSIAGAADLLKKRTGIPDYRFTHLMGLRACDDFTAVLSILSQTPVPSEIERERARFADAMVDCQFQIGGARIAIAADADLLASLSAFFESMGADVVAAVISARADYLTSIPSGSMIVGDLEDFENYASRTKAELIVTNSHGAEIARRLGVGLLRAGFPIYDSYGAPMKSWVGYSGSRQILFDAANLLAEHYREIQPYRSKYWRNTPREREKQTRQC